jgi:hypothetical protein
MSPSFSVEGGRVRQTYCPPQFFERFYEHAKKDTRTVRPFKKVLTEGFYPLPTQRTFISRERFEIVKVIR